MTPMHMTCINERIRLVLFFGIDLHYISMIEPNQNNSFFICVGVQHVHMSNIGHVFDSVLLNIELLDSRFLYSR